MGNDTCCDKSHPEIITTLQMSMGSGAPLMLICSGIYLIDKSKGRKYFVMISLDNSSG